MLKFVILLSCAAFASTFDPFKSSAATPAQIRFAEENKYDDTGPGTRREVAYHTYKNLDDALVAYLDDPDTKLPDFERARALDLLYSRKPFSNVQYSNKPSLFNNLVSNDLFERRPSFSSYDSRLEGTKYPLRWRLPPRLFREPEAAEQRPKLLYKYTSGVQKPESQLAAQESRQDGVVHGYYTYVDAAGKHRTVRYRDERGKGQ